METYGNWSSADGINDFRTSHINSRRRINLHGTKITMSLVITNNDSLYHLDDYRYETFGTWQVLHLYLN